MTTSSTINELELSVYNFFGTFSIKSIFYFPTSPISAATLPWKTLTT